MADSSRPQSHRPSPAADLTAMDSSLGLGHNHHVANVRSLPGQESRGMLLDDRGTGLRLTWHGEAGVAVLSLWRDERCIGTFPATPDDMAAVIAILSRALAGAAAAHGQEVPDTA